MIDDEQSEDDKDGFLFDEQNDPTPIQANEEAYEDYSDPNWVPAANDAEPSMTHRNIDWELHDPTDTGCSLPCSETSRYHQHSC
jgi:hypothetical protein